MPFQHKKTMRGMHSNSKKTITQMVIFRVELKPVVFIGQQYFI
jgi:hypothetical protein